MVELCAGDDAIVSQVGDIEPIKSGTGCADLGGVVNKGLEGDIVGGDLELKVGLWVVDAVVLRGR